MICEQFIEHASDQTHCLMQHEKICCRKIKHDNNTIRWRYMISEQFIEHASDQTHCIMQHEKICNRKIKHDNNTTIQLYMNTPPSQLYNSARENWL